MAITSRLIGALGAGKVTESRFWFSDPRRAMVDINKSWAVPQGDYLFAWRGDMARVYGTKGGGVIVNGTRTVINTAINADLQVGGWVILRNITQIKVSGDGSTDARFTEDPYVAFVRIS